METIKHTSLIEEHTLLEVDYNELQFRHDTLLKLVEVYREQFGFLSKPEIVKAEKEYEKTMEDL